MRTQLAELARALPAAHDVPGLAEALDRLAEQRAGARLADAFARDAATLERRVRGELAPLLSALGEHVAQVAGRVGGLVVEASNPTGTERARIEYILSAAELGAWNGKHLRPVLERHWAKVGERTLATINTKAGLDRPLTLRDTLARGILEQGGRRAGLVDIDADTRRALFRVLAQAKEDGLNPKQTARLIGDQVPAGRFAEAGPRYRAELIARTETLHAQRYSSLGLYRDSDQVTGVIAFDGDGDPECRSRNGQRFSLTDAELESLATHPNCVLSWAPATS